MPEGTLTSEKVRRKVGTSIAGAAKSVAALRFAAPVIRSLYIKVSAAVYVMTLATPAVVVVVPVVPVVPVVLVLAVPPMVSALAEDQHGTELVGNDTDGRIGRNRRGTGRERERIGAGDRDDLVQDGW